MPRSRDRPVWPATAGARIALVADCADWHTRELTRAFAALGARAVLVTLPSCAIETGRSSGLTISGFADGLPDAVVVRSMSGGTFEAVTRRHGVERCPHHRALRRQVDDELPAGARRHPDAGNLGDGAARGRAGDRTA